MTNKKENAVLADNENVVANDQVQVMAVDMEEEIEVTGSTITLFREQIKRDKLYNNFYVNVTAFGTVLTAYLVVKDIGAYKLVDIIFGQSNQVEMSLDVMRRKDMNSNKTVKSLVYKIERLDENGYGLSLAMRPNTDSDRSILEYYAKAFLKLSI